MISTSFTSRLRVDLLRLRLRPRFPVGQVHRHLPLQVQVVTIDAHSGAEIEFPTFLFCLKFALVSSLLVAQRLMPRNYFGLRARPTARVIFPRLQCDQMARLFVQYLAI